MQNVVEEIITHVTGESGEARRERHQLAVNPHLVRVRNELVNRVITDLQRLRYAPRRAFVFEKVEIELELLSSNGFSVDFLIKEPGIGETGFTFFTEAIHGREYREVPLSRIDVRSDEEDPQIRQRVIGGHARILGDFAGHYMAAEVNKWDVLIPGEYPNWKTRTEPYVPPPPGTRKIIDVEAEMEFSERMIRSATMSPERRQLAKTSYRKLAEEKSRMLEVRKTLFGQQSVAEPPAAQAPWSGRPIIMTLRVSEDYARSLDITPALLRLDPDLIGELLDEQIPHEYALRAAFAECVGDQQEDALAISAHLTTSRDEFGQMLQPTYEVDAPDDMRSWILETRKDVAHCPPPGHTT